MIKTAEFTNYLIGLKKSSAHSLISKIKKGDEDQTLLKFGKKEFHEVMVKFANMFLHYNQGEENLRISTNKMGSILKDPSLDNDKIEKIVRKILESNNAFKMLSNVKNLLGIIKDYKIDLNWWEMADLIFNFGPEQKMRFARAFYEQEDDDIVDYLEQIKNNNAVDLIADIKGGNRSYSLLKHCGTKDYDIAVKFSELFFRYHQGCPVLLNSNERLGFIFKKLDLDDEKKDKLVYRIHESLQSDKMLKEVKKLLGIIAVDRVSINWKELYSLVVSCNKKLRFMLAKDFY